jgi:hypothetical protein
MGKHKPLQDMGAPKKEKDLKKYLKITNAYKSQVMDNTWNVLSLNHVPKELHRLDTLNL